MSLTIVPPSPAVALRRMATRAWDSPDSRSVLIGIGGVLVVHLLLFLIAPKLFQSSPATALQRRSTPRQFNIALAPETFLKKKAPPKPPPPGRFVETNPNAPDNVPDRTTNFAAQNQQAAQEKPQANAHNDRPQLEGKKDIQSTQIVTGQLTKPQETVPIAPAVEKPVKPAAAIRQEQNPLTGFDKALGTDAQSFGSNIARVPENSRPIPEKIDGSKDAPLLEGAASNQNAIDPKHPRPRVSLEHTQVRPAIFQDNPIGTSNIGIAGWDAKWSSYGAYLKKLIEAVQVQWDRILNDSRTYPPSGSQVTVKFRLDSKGLITDILDVQSSSSEQGKGACVSAITSRAPYGDWSEDMIAVLGTSQELTFTFFYQ